MAAAEESAHPGLQLALVRREKVILSNRNGLKNTRNMLRVFGGLNETYSCTEAEYSAGINFSARNFPALSTRLPRRKLREEAD